MIKKIIFSILLLCCQYMSLAQTDYALYPRYKEVVRTYFTNYAMANQSKDDIIKFEKHPDGWHVCIKAYTANYPLIKEGLLWSLKSQSYKELDFIKKNSSEGEHPEYQTFINNWEGVHYDASPYFGYVGCDWDVIQVYGNAQNLPDTVLYAVGRAYSAYASNLLNDNSGLSDSTHRFKLKDGLMALSPEQLSKYRFYRYKAIEIFKQVKARNPDFETLVGSIGLKLSHEYVTAFIDMRQFQSDEEAMKEIPDGIYSEFYISLAKNYLNSCDKNAILFVNGDTDTFTLLYVQAKYHIRTDVTVINTSLLLTPRYIDHLRYPFLGTPGLTFLHSAASIANPNREVIYVQTELTKTWSIKELIDYINQDQNVTTLEQGQYIIVNGKTLTTEIKHKTISWPLTSKGYLMRDELMMMDIMSTYGNKRPIYFAQTLSSEKYLELNQYLSLEGLAYRLTNTSQEPVIYDGTIATNTLYKNLMTVFTFKGNEQSQLLDNRFRNNYALEFGWLTYMLMNEKKDKQAKEVLEAYFKAFPNSCAPYDNSVLYLMKCYYALGEMYKANEIGKQIIINMQQHRVHQTSLFETETETTANAKALAEIMEMSNTYNQQSFYKNWLGY